MPPSDYSIEVTLRDPEAVAACARRLPPGAEVFLADLPDQPPDLLVETAMRYHRAGLRPVPHLVARNIAGEAALRDLLERLTRHAGVERVFLLGGDREAPAGPFAEALDLLATGLLPRHGIGRVVFACFPEGHPRIRRAALDRALESKLRAARADGLDVLLVSQFVLAAPPLLAYVADLRAEGVLMPLRVGLAGPADKATLRKFGRELGAGASIRAVDEALGDDAARLTPDALLAALGPAWADLRLEQPHYFAFGSVEDTLAWAEARRPEAAAPGPAGTAAARGS